MADRTGIEWTDATWNPLRGCTRVSEGCRNCYAEVVAARFSGPGQPYEGLAKWVDRPGEKREARWTGKVTLVESAINQPLRWKRPRRIFVNSMSDLFHESVPDEWITEIFAAMGLARQHTFQVLTKRPERMRAYLLDFHNRYPKVRPLPNIWLGVSVEDQKTADERIPLLLDTPAAVRWVSAEPLLGPVDLRYVSPNSAQILNALIGPSRTPDYSGWRALDWVVVGGESGPGARPMHPDWARSIRDQCDAAEVPFLFKQWGEWAPNIGAVDQFNVDDDAEVSRFPHLEWTDESWSQPFYPAWFDHVDGNYDFSQVVSRIGKKAAGRLLDGVLHDGYPEVRFNG